MSKEYFIIIAVTAVSLASIFYIPKERYRLALVSFLVSQVISWPQPLLFVQIGYVEFPVREFMRATKLSFSILYLFLPMIFAWFMLLFPQNALVLRKIIHYLIFVSIIVWFTYFNSVYTDLQVFLKGTMLFNVSFLYFRVTLYFIISRLFIKWFFKGTYMLAGGLDA